MEKAEINNKRIVELLNNVAAANDVLGENVFKVRAYRQAADVVSNTSEDLRGVWEEGGLDKISGIGPSIKSHLDELFRTGRVEHFEEITGKLPAGMFPLLAIPGIGPKSALKLAKHLGINKEHHAIHRLKKAAEKGDVEKIEGFGAESQENILAGIAALEKREDKMLLPVAADIADRIAAHLKKSPQVLRVEILGSLRRRAPLVGDVDVAVATHHPAEVIKQFSSFPEWKDVIAEGGITARAIHRSGYNVDLKTESPRKFGALLQHFTGSQAHNVALREFAIKKGLSLSEHGIKKLRDSASNVQRYADEKSFYKALGLSWIPPELRENRGEIEAAHAASLPTLVKPEQIKGDFHIHSNINIETSHDLGVSSLDDIAHQAEKLGYEYIAITDHNPSGSTHDQLEIMSLVTMRNRIIDEFITSRENNVKIRVFKSLEVDILPDGKLAVDDDVLSLLDFAIVSVHSSFGGTRVEQTARVLAALNHPRVKIFGHPTGRILGRRDGIALDWEQIFDFCLERQIFLEINAGPRRLDLPDDLIFSAVKRGLRFTIGTDSHDAAHLSFMNFGVDQARRGWTEAEDILNTMGYNKARELLGIADEDKLKNEDRRSVVIKQ